MPMRYVYLGNVSTYVAESNEHACMYQGNSETEKKTNTKKATFSRSN